jgi:hypothetical protein
MAFLLFKTAESPAENPAENPEMEENLNGQIALHTNAKTEHRIKIQPCRK